MKPVDIGNYIGLDRLATRNEVMRAISVAAGGNPAVGGLGREMDFDFDWGASNTPEDDMWFAIVRELQDSTKN